MAPAQAGDSTHYRERIGSINVICYQIEAAHSRANMMKIEI